eukprot:ANDGO_08202.mRNA.1 hypothetical protein
MIFSLASIVLMLYFLFPRFPKIEDVFVDVPSLELSRYPALNTYGVRIALDFSMDVGNDNFVAFEIQDLTLHVVDVTTGVTLVDYIKSAVIIPAKEGRRYAIQIDSEKRGLQFYDVWRNCAHERSVSVSITVVTGVRYLGFSFEESFPIRESIPCNVT